MIRAVFLDFYGTLAGWQPAGAQIQQEAAAAEGLTVDAAAIDMAYPTANAFMDSENAIRRIAARTEAERGEFFARYEQLLLATAGHDVSREYADRVWRRVRDTPKRLGLYPDSLPAVQALAADGRTVGVISNMGTELHQMIEELGLAAHVSVTVSSGEVGVSKPHPAVFQAALDRAGVAADEALHVGDGYESDAMGARNAGIHPLLLIREAGIHAPADCPTVRSLTEVLPYVTENLDDS
jgi:HAD superfamily hydrolase (TIGR01549 family)